MIWNSIVAMTLIDLLIIGAVTIVSVAVWRTRDKAQRREFACGPLLVLIGLLCIALFHAADLITMHVLPGILGEAEAMALMTLLHLNVSWLVTLISFPLICGGFLLARSFRRKAVAELEASETRYRSIVSDQSEFIVRWQPGGLRTWVNDPYCQFFGISREEAVGTSFLNLILEPDRARIVAELAALTRESPSRRGVHRVALRNGEISWQEWTDTALFDGVGRLLEFQSVGRDITQRIRTATALEQSEARFRGFVENTSDWVWEMDAEGRNTYSNRQVEKMLGYAPRELYRQHWHTLVHPDDLEEAEIRFRSIQHEQHGWQRWTMRMRHRDGSYRYLESTADPVLDENGKVVGYRGIDRDATFATLMAQISTKLVGTTVTDLDDRIVEALGHIGLCYGIERVSLWWLEGTYVLRSHEWAEAGHSGPVTEIATDEKVPWCSTRLRKGQSVILESLDELPDDTVDREFLERMGPRSIVLLPLTHEKELIGVAAFATISRERDWHERIESELRLLSEKIAAAYAQSEATKTILRRKRDLAQSEALAHVGSFAYYPYTEEAKFPDDWRAEFSEEQCAQLGIERQDASFDAFLSRVHEDDRQQVLNAAEWLLSEGTEIELQYRLVSSTGELVYLANSTRVDRNQEGRVLRIIGSNRDITEQVLREESLKNALAEISELRDRLERENIQLREEVRTVKEFEQIIGESESLRNCLDLVAKVAPTDAAVLILGETGTGKELIARAIHDLSPRRDKRLVSLNCTALPPDLVESELFGHERGAFTDAHTQRQGRFELADGGTLFLDEIGDLPLSLQAKLLRVLEDGTFQRLGGTTTLRVDVRLVTATNRNLVEAIDEGAFRSDLYYRINTVPVELPPLRDRKEDIPLLAHYFVKKHGPRLEKPVEFISAGFLRHIQNRNWPGNVRELEHFIERSLVASNGSVLALDDRITKKNGNGSTTANNGNGGPANLQAVEKEYISQVLQEASWVIGGAQGAAAQLGLPPSTLRSKMKKLGIRREA